MIKIYDNFLLWFLNFTILNVCYISSIIPSRNTFHNQQEPSCSHVHIGLPIFLHTTHVSYGGASGEDGEEGGYSVCRVDQN